MPSKETEEITRQIDRMRFETDEKGTMGAQQEPDRHPLDRILVAMDGSSGSRMALAWGIHIAKAHESRLTVCIVLPEKHPVHGTTLPAINPRSARLWEELVKDEEASAKKILDQAVEQSEQAGVRVERRLGRGSVVDQITRLAESQKNDLVILGSHGRKGLPRFMLGSVAEGVRDHVDASVLIARNEPTPDRILLGVDGSGPSQKAGALVAELMEKTPAQVHVVHVVHSPVEGLESGLQERWEKAAQDLRAPLMEHAGFPQGSWVHYDVHLGDPADELLRVAKEDRSGLIVLGSRGRSGLRSLIAGSVSRKVSRDTETSVLIVK